MPSQVIRIMCPRLTCRRILAVPSAARGRTVRCRNCGASIRIPDKSVPPVAPPAKPDDEARIGEADAA